MGKRWQANRMGFVNFWLYDEEEFFFDKGRLLLRGENASGKSITTQSMIPFILDGDRSPERLDPFGSRDRKMDYYLLGDNEREEATGYIYLEFKKQDIDQYCTIGIGQRAQKGKQMHFWGFIMLDNRRIGKDLQLYRQVGSKKIPKTRQELKNDIGEQNVFVDKPKEYMAMVNKHIFGFPRIELYEQFIRLLIKVRAPKLSKDLKPSMVYDILNESLQTLSDDDIKLLVDAMEQLDTIQATIDGLKSTKKDVGNVRTEYDRYNRFMLSSKAKRYYQHHQSYEKECSTLESEQQKVVAKQQLQDQLRKQLDAALDQIAILEQEKGLINDQDIQEKYRQLETAQQNNENYQKLKKEQEAKLEDINEKIIEYRRNLDGVKDQIDTLRYDMSKKQTDIQTTCKEQEFRLNLSLHEDDTKVTQAYSELAQMKQELEEAYKILLSYEQENERLAKLNEALSILSNEQGQIQNQLEQAKDMVDSEKDTLIETIYKQKQDNQYLQWEEPTSLHIQGLIRNYQGFEQQNELLNIYRSIYDNNRNYRQQKKLELGHEKSQSEKTINRIKKELEDLRLMKEPIIAHKEKVDRTRELLKTKGIRYMPFYQAIEFVEDVSEQQQNLIEAQLTECGILDALIIAETDMHRIQQEWDLISDVILSPMKTNKHVYPYLQSGDIDSALKSQVEKILCSIGGNRQMSCDIILEENGYFRHGLLEGHCMVDEPACYIGVNARLRKQQQLIKEKEKELKEACELLESIVQDLSNINNELECLEQEYQLLPKFDNLNAALRVVQETADSFKRKQAEYLEKEAEVNQSSKNYSRLHQEVIERCRKFNFERTSNRYEQVLVTCDTVKEYLDDYKVFCGNIRNKLELKCVYTRDVEDFERQKDDVAHDLSIWIREIQRVEATIQQLLQFLNQPENIDVLQQLESIKEALQTLHEKVDRDKNTLTELNITQVQLQNSIHQLQEKIKQMKIVDEELLTIYKEELGLEFVIPLENKTSMECLPAAIACLSAQDKDKNRSAVDMTMSLSKSFQRHSHNLLTYGAVLENLFEDNSEYLRRRSVIYLDWNGQKLNLEQFYNVLISSIEENEMMIQEKDRKIFEDILSGTVSQKLSNRIADSRKWIDEMSDMMWKMETSMGLNFKLKWKAKTPDSDQELNIEELEKLLNRDKELLTKEDMEKVSAHFRSKIQTAKLIAEEKEDVFNYGDLIRDALDYRKWFEFHMYFAHAGESTKELTNSAFNKFSGGEKAMAMYVPLFAAVNAQYKKCGKQEHPRIIALDEAFAGVDDKNISVMFDLVEKLDFDYIMNSQALWGCYAEVSSLHIAELVRPVNSKVVTIINYHWNGRKREVV